MFSGIHKSLRQTKRVLLHHRHLNRLTRRPEEKYQGHRQLRREQQVGQELVVKDDATIHVRESNKKGRGVRPFFVSFSSDPSPASVRGEQWVSSPTPSSQIDAVPHCRVSVHSQALLLRFVCLAALSQLPHDRNRGFRSNDRSDSRRCDRLVCR
jgi:hypothetical protein